MAIPVFAAAFALAMAAQTGSGNAAPPAPAKPASTQSESVIHPPPPGYRFPENMVLHYRAEWRLVTAGYATLRVEPDANNQIRVSATADASGFVARLYHVHDIFDSHFGRDSFCSNLLHKHTEEGFRRRDETLRFDYARGLAIRDELDMKKNERHHLENAIPSCSTDVISALVYAGALPLEAGQSYNFPLNDGGKTAELHLMVEGREQIKTPAGTFNTIRVQPTSDAELLKKRGKVWVWYSDDALRIPVQMRGRMGWGALTLTLDRIERTVAKP